MGKSYTAHFADGSERIVADFSMNRAKLFYEMTKLMEQFVHHPSGVEDDQGEDEHKVDADTFIAFFEEFWKIGWLGDIQDSFVIGWARWAAGIAENITLTPVVWTDRNGEVLEAARHILGDKELEALLQQRAKEGKGEIRKPSNKLTDIVIPRRRWPLT